MIRLHFDAGHGGNDPGACANNMIEKDITLAVCLKIEEKLREYKDVEVTRQPTHSVNYVKKYLLKCWKLLKLTHQSEVMKQEQA